MQTPKKSFDTPPQHRVIKSTGSKSPLALEEGGRFISHRVSTNLKHLFEKVDQEPSQNRPINDENQIFSKLVHKQLFGASTTDTKRHRSRSRSKSSMRTNLENKENFPLFPTLSCGQPPRDSHRNFPSLPYKILDAPNLKDDFYYNLVDWSAQNLLAVGLGSHIYSWNAFTSSVSLLANIQLDMTSSLSWDPTGNQLAAATETGKLKLFDIQRSTPIQDIQTHSKRIGCICWNGNLITTGSRDGTIAHTDIRTGIISPHIKAHQQEVCGLKWSPDGRCFASGGNDNRLLLWSAYNNASVGTLAGHTAAVKAIDWSPHQQGILASGGGTADKTIRIWNSYSLEEMACVDTGSQVCNLKFSMNSQELVSTHGYSQNQVIVWKYPSLQQVGMLKGHHNRVLYLAMSPDGENVVTGAGDETLRFWKLFEKVDEGVKKSSKIELNVDNLR